MARFVDTREAGRRAEQMVREILLGYTKYVYSNVRVDTLFTKGGTTEIDILAAISDIILIVEVKNISCIDGEVSDSVWNLTGLETGERYTTLNVLTQNRIHVRSFKDAWFANRGEMPNVISVVVVPNECVIPEDIASQGVLTLQKFSSEVARLVADSTYTKYGYALDYVVKDDNSYIQRADFVGGNYG